MSKVYVGARIPVSLHQRLSEHIDKTGASKSEVMASALAAYLGSVQDVSLREMVFQLDQRVATLEAELRRQYSGTEHRVLSGIGLVNCVYVNPELGLFWVIDYRIYQPESDDKTKLDHVADMLKKGETAQRSI